MSWERAVGKPVREVRPGECRKALRLAGILTFLVDMGKVTEDELGALGKEAVEQYRRWDAEKKR